MTITNMDSSLREEEPPALTPKTITVQRSFCKKLEWTLKQSVFDSVEIHHEEVYMVQPNDFC